MFVKFKCNASKIPEDPIMAVKEPGSNSPLTERRISLLPGPNENHNSRTVYSV